MAFNLKRYLEASSKDVEVTEKQLHGKSDADSAPKTTTQDQLKGSRVDKDPETTTEAQLNKVRKAEPNIKLNKVAAKKDDAQITEKQLEHTDKAPTTITEDQLADDHSGDEDNRTIEKSLERVRTGAAEVLVEKRLDDNKSKIVKHRNADTAKGNLNQLDAQRLANKKPADKIKPASETPQEQVIQEIPTTGGDNLRLAQNSAQKKTL